jgi:hypothetical protein
VALPPSLESSHADPSCVFVRNDALPLAEKTPSRGLVKHLRVTVAVDEREREGGRRGCAQSRCESKIQIEFRTKIRGLVWISHDIAVSRELPSHVSRKGQQRMVESRFEMASDPSRRGESTAKRVLKMQRRKMRCRWSSERRDQTGRDGPE